MARLLILGWTVMLIFAASAGAQSKCDDLKGNNRPLCFIKRPAPRYTDEARKKGLKGTVVVIGEFLSDASVGTVNWVNTDADNAEDLLKFGMVQATIDAVRKIEFRAEVKNGRPTTVTRRLEYRFSIF